MNFAGDIDCLKNRREYLLRRETDWTNVGETHRLDICCGCSLNVNLLWMSVGGVASLYIIILVVLEALVVWRGLVDWLWWLVWSGD